MLATSNGYSVDRVEELSVWILNSESKGFRGGAGTYAITAQGYKLDGAEGEISFQLYTNTPKLHFYLKKMKI